MSSKRVSYKRAFAGKSFEAAVEAVAHRSKFVPITCIALCSLLNFHELFYLSPLTPCPRNTVHKRPFNLPCPVLPCHAVPYPKITP